MSCRLPILFAVSALVSFLLVSGGNAAKLGEKCSASSRCIHGLWCDPSPGQCGAAADREGTCVRVGQLCFQLTRSVCGCNGKTYPNECQRIRARIAKSHIGRCQT